MRSAQEVEVYCGVGFKRYSLEDAEGVLYERWRYQDNRYGAAERYALDCEPADDFADTAEASAIARAIGDSEGWGR